MSTSSFFASLGAPLVNSRWSWGARRSSDGAIFLRVFQEEKWIADGRLHMAIGWDLELIGDDQRLAISGACVTWPPSGPARHAVWLRIPARLQGVGGLRSSMKMTSALGVN